MDEQLSRAVAAFDGVDFAPLDAVLASGVPSAEQLADLVVLIEVGDATARLAAAHALATAVGQGAPLLPAERRRVLARLGAAEPAACAELCRAVRHLRVPPDVAEATCAELADLAGHADRRVRRAALDALDGLATRFGALRARVEPLLTRALEDPAPSVRAQAKLLRRPSG